MWHFFKKKKKSTLAQVFIFIFYFYYETQVFKTRFKQQIQVSGTRVSKKCYIATYFVNSGMLLIISAKSGK